MSECCRDHVWTTILSATAASLKTLRSWGVLLIAMGFRRPGKCDILSVKHCLSSSIPSQGRVQRLLLCKSSSKQFSLDKARVHWQCQELLLQGEAKMWSYVAATVLQCNTYLVKISIFKNSLCFQTAREIHGPLPNGTWGGFLPCP